MTINIDDFKAALRQKTAREIVESIILGNPPVHFSAEKIDVVASSLATAYGLDKASIEIVVSGSARLGFSLVEKSGPNGPRPRYRPFSVESDIDLAVISPGIFDAIWHDLTSYSHRAPRFPWAAGRTGDYLICGWLRPDHFPKGVRLRNCDAWWDTFNKISRNPQLDYRRVRGGLYYSKEKLLQYMTRSVGECVQLERLT